METIKYPTRCINHFFGYCSENVKGDVISVDNMTFERTKGDCKKNWLECKSYVTNTIANPYRPELEKTKVRKVKIENGQTDTD